MVNSKTCLRCDGIYSIADFGKDNSKPDNRMIYCRNCTRKINKANKSRPAFKESRKLKRRKYSDKERNWLLKYRYGITLEEFNNMFELQGRTCALCDSSKSDSKNFVVDHDHKSGKVRGILCSYCNRALGMFKDDVDILNKAIVYLKRLHA